MNQVEIWEIETRIKIDIVTDTFEYHGEQEFEPNLGKIELIPSLAEDESIKDLFVLKIQFSFHSKDGKSSATEIINIGKKYLYETISRLSFLANIPIITSSPPVLTYQFPNTNRFRKILLAAEQKELRPPKVINNFDLLKIKLDSKIIRALVLINESMLTNDLIGSYIYLWSALEILVNLYDIPNFKPKSCNFCGNIYQKEPGIADRVRFILISHFSKSSDVVEKIWKLRNEISHHGLELSNSELTYIENMRNSLYQIVRTVIIDQLGNSYNCDNESIPFNSITGAFLDLEYFV